MQYQVMYLHHWCTEGVAGHPSVGVVTVKSESQCGGLAHH